MIEFVTLRLKTYSCLIDDGCEENKARETKKCIIKQRLKFEDYKKCLLVIKLYEDYNKGLKVNCIMYLLTKLTRWH